LDLPWAVDALGTGSFIFDDDVAVFAPVSGSCRPVGFNRLKVIALPAIRLVTFRTIAIPQLIGHDRQMAVAALDLVLGIREQYKIVVVTLCHGHIDAGTALLPPGLRGEVFSCLQPRHF
jgi:hypothetical protein